MWLIFIHLREVYESVEFYTFEGPTMASIASVSTGKQTMLPDDW